MRSHKDDELGGYAGLYRTMTDLQQHNEALEVEIERLRQEVDRWKSLAEEHGWRLIGEPFREGEL